MTHIRYFSIGLCIISFMLPAHAAKTGPNATPNSPIVQQPINIDANQMEVRDKEHLAIFTGKVVAIQGNTRLETDQMKVYYEGKTATDTEALSAEGGLGDNKIKRIEATGSVRVVQGAQIASGQKGVYELATSQITLTGDVVLVQNGNVVHGNQLVVNTLTQESRVLSSGSTRVRALIIPQSETKKEPATSSITSPLPRP